MKNLILFFFDRIFIRYQPPHSVEMMAACSKFSRVSSPLRSIYLYPAARYGHNHGKQMLLSRRSYQTLMNRGVIYPYKPVLLRPIPFQNPAVYQTRNVGMLVARILRGALKIRYLLIGGAVGTGISLQKVSFFVKITVSLGPLLCKAKHWYIYTSI